MRIKITWQGSGATEICTAYNSIDRLARDYFGLGGGIPAGVTVEDMDAKPAPAPEPEPVVVPEPAPEPVKPAAKKKAK
jgi:hypothetical protein